MKNIIYLAGCLMLLGACNNSKYDLENLVPQEYHKILYINNSGKQEMTLYDTGEDYFYTMSIVKSGSDPTQAANVKINVLGQEEIDRLYSIPEGVDYKVLSEGSFSLETSDLSFSSEERLKSVNISVNSAKVKALVENYPDAEWVLPLKVTSLTDSINSEKNELFLQIRLSVPTVGFTNLEDKIKTFELGEIPSTIREELEIGLSTENRWDISCEIQEDVNLIGTYNSEYGTSFQMMPEGSYSFSKSLLLPNGTTTSKLDVTIDGSKFTALGDYMLPIRIKDVSRYAVSADNDVYWIKIRIRMVTEELDRTGWTATADSEETDGADETANKVLDGDLSTHWHSYWSNIDSSQKADLPYEIIIDTKQTYAFSQIGMIQRSGGVYMDTKSGEFYISSDGTNWGEPVGNFTMQQNMDRQMFSVMPKNGRYVKIKILSSYRDSFCSLSEIYIYGKEL